jgi:hypothetical protein
MSLLRIDFEKGFTARYYLTLIVAIETICYYRQRSKFFTKE